MWEVALSLWTAASTVHPKVPLVRLGSQSIRAKSLCWASQKLRAFARKVPFFSGGGILFGGQRLHGGVEIVRGARSLAKA